MKISGIHTLNMSSELKLKFLNFVLLLTLFIISTKTVQIAAAPSYEPLKYTCPAKSSTIYPCICLNGSDDGLYIRCDNTNLALLSVALQNLAALNKPIEKLIINNGHFGKLYGPIFSKTKVRILSIEDTKIKEIEENTFFGINTTLEKVHFSGSNFTVLLPQTFGILGKVNELRIDGHTFEKVEKNLFYNQQISNSLEILSIINGPLTDVPIESFQNLRKLKNLDLHGNNLVNLKRNQFKNLREVEALDLSFNKITKLEAHHIFDLTKLGWCNMSNNALTEVARGTFARNAVLKVLNLSHNKISRLDGNSFRGMRFLRRLYLNDNQITDIGRGTFGALTRIGTIDLARNHLKKIDYQMFAELQYVEILNIAENEVKLIEKQSFKNIYQAKINISHNEVERIEPYSFENCINITVLDLSFNRLKNFSMSTFDATTFATELQLSHNYLEDLGQIPLHNMTGLKVLNASFNNVQRVPKNCFPKLYELHTIDVSNNNLSFIANGVFQTLFSLRSLNISHNSLNDIKSSMFGTLPTLLEMDLSYNNLTSIARGALAKLTSLRRLLLHNNYLETLFQIPISLNELYLQNNSLKSIPAGTWPVMNSLLYLDLSDNKIGDSLEEDSFKGLLVLQKLLLKKNGISKPPVRCLSPLSTLQFLYLNSNNITELEKNAFGKLPVLFELNLSQNRINNISKLAFDGLLQLLTLNLSENVLSYIPNDAFLGLPSLRNLDLSHNLLTKLENKTNGVLDDLLSLENLNLSHNKISFVTKKTFPSNQYVPYNLRYLDLSHNQMPVLTFDITFGTKKLWKLNLSDNNINEIRRGVLANFSSLEFLDLSNNELSNLMSEEHNFDLPRSLREIHLKNNKIYRIPYDNFLKEPKMEVIDLRNNSLEEFPLALLWIIKNGTNVSFSGNPLNCNCAVRPLKHYMITTTHLKENLRDISCTHPIHLTSQKLANVKDEQLQCTIDYNNLYKGEVYDVLADIRFRDISVKNNYLTASWFVPSPRDIADFTIYVRTKENALLFHEDYMYNTRNAKIPIGFLMNKISSLDNAEVCIISRNSEGSVGRWFSDQCRKLPRAVKQKNWFSASSSHQYTTDGFVLLVIYFINICLV